METTERNKGKISVAEARTMLEKEGMQVTPQQAQMILDFLSKIAQILVAQDILKL